MSRFHGVVCMNDETQQDAPTEATGDLSDCEILDSEGEAIEALHADIEDGEVGPRGRGRGEGGEGGLAGGILDAGEAEGKEEIGEERAVDGVVVDDEHVTRWAAVTGEAAAGGNARGVGRDDGERNGEGE
eukprot:gene17193-21021_t